MPRTLAAFLELGANRSLDRCRGSREEGWLAHRNPKAQGVTDDQEEPRTLDGLDPMFNYICIEEINQATRQ
jgi:hypothetical protein